MTTRECPSRSQLQKHMAGERTMLPKQPKSATTKTRLWTDPLQFNDCSKIMEQPAHPYGSG